jgi:hypothetical protein
VLGTVLKTVVEPDQMRAKQILREAYVASSGLFDHLGHHARKGVLPLDQQRELISDELYPGEDLSLSSPFKSIMRRYIDAKVLTYFGLSFTEFISLPHVHCEEIFEVCREMLSRDDARQKQVLSELKATAEPKLTRHSA